MKKWLLALGAVVALGVFFWMRALASWRPVKIGRIEQKMFVSHLSSDGRTALLMTDVPSPSKIKNIQSGATIKWPETNSVNLSYSTRSPEWVAVAEKKELQGELRVREMQSGQLKSVFHWPVKGQLSDCVVLAGRDGKTLALVDFPLFLEWNIERKTLLRRVVLQGRVRNDSGYPAKYALSLDGKELFGCVGKRGRAWNLPTGKMKRSHLTQAAGYPLAFSPDARVIVYSYSSTTNYQAPSDFVDTATGVVRWTASGDFRNCFFDAQSEIVVPQESNCEVVDVLTGHVLRKLPGPRQGDGEILRVTSDFIYTLNARNEIYRWRAR